MKANELMIGDLLVAYHDDGETQRYFPVIVDGIDKNGTLVDGNCYISWTPLRKEDCKEEYADELSPIPLTPEILEKNGFILNEVDDWFEYENNHRYYVVIFFCRELDTDEIQNDSFTIFNGCDCRFVHQLQHALRLCGLNDLADNFKV